MGVGQCVANILIFEYIQIFIYKYIHSLKYFWIFPKRIYSDIHSRLFPLHEYIWTIIGNVRFQRIQWFEATQQNETSYSKKFRQKDILVISVFFLNPLSSSPISSSLFVYNHLQKYLVNIFHLNIFVHSFVNILHGKIYLDIHL